jgi:hypothetical protein
MTAATVSAINTSPSRSTDTTTRTETEHYSSRRNENRERDPRATRSNDSHLGILIDGCGPASGRPEPTLRAVDLSWLDFKIVSVGSGVASC